MYVLSVEAPDQIGLVAKIASAIADTGCNITATHEFVAKESATFFMRCEFNNPNLNKLALIEQLKQTLPKASKINLQSNLERKIIVFATKEFHCLGEILLRCHFKEFNAKIMAVISNHQTLADLVEKFSISFHYVATENLSRIEHENKILETLDKYQVDFFVLAKYMRILSPDFVAKFPNKIINIHHSFLPAFIGAKPYHQAHARGVKIIGATSHFVTNDLDEGPIIAQGVLPVDHSHSAEEMSQAGRDIEKSTLAKALRLVFEERVIVHNNKTIILE